ncbi:MAG: DUF2064 domain-containing protein [Candidatus Limnocylindrales bacterium]
MRVAAVVPVLNERTAIGDVVVGLRSAGACCVLVIDSGSSDGTREVAVQAGARVIDEPRRGYGRACLSGAREALARAADGHTHDAVAFLDGDGSCDPADLPSLVAAIDDADVVLGRRPRLMMEASAMPWHARVGNALVAEIITLRSGRAVHDLPPFKVIRRTTLEGLDLDDAAYGWSVQLVARACCEPSIRVREIPVGFRVRRGGVSKVSGSWHASIRAGRTMITVALKETRRRPILALMAKAPGPGHAKTRLAGALGEDETAGLWTACLADVAEAARTAAQAVGARSIVMLPGNRDIDPIIRIIGSGWIPSVQRRAGLGAALVDVFLAAFDRNADRAVAVAGDAPALPPSHIAAAYTELRAGTNAAVIGPSADGGYHLIGLRWTTGAAWWPRRVRERRRRRLAGRLSKVFDTVPMGGASALDATMGTLGAAGWRVSQTPSWPDLDTLADLRALDNALADGGWAPRTAAWIERHRAIIQPPADASILKDGTIK